MVSIINDSYAGSIKNLKNEMIPSIRAGIIEGFQEGIEKGVEQGILEGLTECLDLGFVNLKQTDPKDLEEILKEAASDSIKAQVKQKSQEKICPVLGKEVETVCIKLLKKIEETDITVSKEVLDIARAINVENMIKPEIDELEQEVTQYIPKNNFIYDIFFEPLKQSLYQCLNKKFNSCTERIEKSLTKS